MDDIDNYIAEQEEERKRYESSRGETMSETDEMFEKAKQMEAEKQEKLKGIDRGISDRLVQEQESRERLSKAIGELFPDKKGKVTLGLEAYFKEQDETKKLLARIDLAKSMGITVEELDVYLQRGETK